MPNNQDHHEEGKIQRKDPANAAPVKNAEIVGRFLRIEQNATDQKSRKHKKEVDAGPPQTHRTDQKLQKTRSASLHGKVKVMVDQNDGDRSSA